MLKVANNYTLLNNFIQQQINSTPLPRYKLIQDNDYMDKGVIYQCKDRILLCTESGYFPGVSGLKTINDYLYVNDTVMVTDDEYAVQRFDRDQQVWTAKPLTVTDDKVIFTPHSAKWKLIDVVDYTKVSHSMEVPNLYESSYSPIVHKYLGDYLRWVSNMTHVDLMPLYNCNTNQLLQGWCIKDNELVELSSSSVHIVPIKFNRTYTISANCSLPVKVSASFIDKGVIKNSETSDFLHKDLRDATVLFTHLDMNKPVTYTLHSGQCVNDSFKKLVDFEKHLYMVIDCGSQDLSSLTVIEGDYTDRSDNCFDIQAIESNALSSAELNRAFASDLSLLSSKRVGYIPFADTLVQYLLGNTIDNRDNIVQNVRDAEYSVDYYSKHPGVWDMKLRYLIYIRCQKLLRKQGLQMVDMFGYVDSEAESLLRRNTK